MKVFILILFFCSCSRTQYLSLREHKFSQSPNKIIWLQLSGWGHDLFPMIKFLPDKEQESVIEKLTCNGEVWNYHFKTLRPMAKDSFTSQLMGRKKIEGTCEDYQEKSFFDYFFELGWTQGIYEIIDHQKNSLQVAKSCREDFLKGASLWISSKNKLTSDEDFHSEIKKNYQPNLVYRDQSCHEGTCYKKSIENINSFIENYFSIKNNFLFMIRDFRLTESGRNLHFDGLENILKEQLEVISRLLNFAQENSDVLLLITGAEPLGIELPGQGKTWEDLDKNKVLKFYKESKLSSVALAYGARAENFCGFYSESDIMRRVLFALKKGFLF